MSDGLGPRLRAARQRAALTATALAGNRLSVATVSRIEHGSIDPSLATLRYLADRLGCTVGDLVDGDMASTGWAALDDLEAWLLLGLPWLALERVDPTRRELAWAGPNGEAAAVLQRLRWVEVRARALLDTGAVEQLDREIEVAHQAGDPWAVAALAVDRSRSLEPPAAIALLHRTLTGLPAGGDDGVHLSLMRATLLLRLAECQEAVGATETARLLYGQAAAITALFRAPDVLARRLLGDPPAGPPRPDSNGRGGTGRRRSVHPFQSPAYALAILVAGGRCDDAASLNLARLDLQQNDIAGAARHLRGAGRRPLDSAAQQTLASLRRDFDRVLDRRTDPAPRLSALATTLLSEPQRAAWRLDLAQLESALSAGHVAAAEAIAGSLAAAFAVDARAFSREVWLRLALAWAEAGDLPHALRALRAGGPPR